MLPHALTALLKPLITVGMMPLLPSGLQDSLPPYAAHERWVMGTLLERFALFGYQHVSPPLLEFEETLLAGKGAAQAQNTFRVMDNASQKMMGLRADITPQIERIATTLLSNGQAVSRLSYAGQVLRVSPTGLNPARQLRQAGIEMIGDATHVSELEVLTAGIEALHVLGLSTLVLGLSYGGLFEALFKNCDTEVAALIRKAVYHKDVGSLPEVTPHKATTVALLTEPLDKLLAMDDLPEKVAHALHEMQRLQRELQQRFPSLHVQIDPLDTEGFDYHTGQCFTLFDSKSRQEVGRGGCYDLSEMQRGCGLTFYVERLIASAITLPSLPNQRIIAADMDYAEAKQLRDAGMVTVVSS
jgi:ATP phosphoribosyltransferase regulatory subunit